MKIFSREHWTVGNWNAYVESGRSTQERAARLQEVPEALRPRVAAHVRCAFAVLAEHRRRVQGKGV